MMEQSERRSYKWTPQRILIAIWAIDFTAVLVALAHPVSIGILRLLVAASVPFLWLLGIFLVRRKRALAAAVALLGVFVIVFSALPGRTVAPADLRTEYVRQLNRYNGTRYVWGGENGRGIDCSGLVRRALINAHMRIAVTTANPAALRRACQLWWYDCSALAMRDQYRDFTTPVFRAESINSITSPLLRPGDLAVTASGIHVLAYLGDQKWIQAEPGIMKVITLTAPDENGWMKQPVHIMRWSNMMESANNALNRTSESRAEARLPESG
jgi:hypothetical protein